MVFRYTARAVGATRGQLEEAAGAEAETFFGTSAEVILVQAEVTSEEQEGGGHRTYEGTFSFEVKGPSAA